MQIKRSSKAKPGSNKFANNGETKMMSSDGRMLASSVRLRRAEKKELAALSPSLALI